MLEKWGMERLAIDTVSVHQFLFYFIGFFFLKGTRQCTRTIDKTVQGILNSDLPSMGETCAKSFKYHNLNTKNHKLNWKTSISHKSLNIFWEVPHKNTKNEAETWKTRTKFPAGGVWAKITITLTKFYLQIGPRCYSSLHRHVELSISHREVWDKKSRVFRIVRYMSR